MTGLHIVSLFCVLIIQRAAGNAGLIQCQPEISLNLEDLLRNIGQGNCNPPITVQESCCNPPSNQQPCGCQPSLSISNSCGCGPSSIASQRSCGYQQSYQPNPCRNGIQQPSFGITSQQSGCGCGIQQSPFAISQPNSIPNQRSCGCQPSTGLAQPPSVNQQCGCGNQQLQTAKSLLSQHCAGNLNNQPCNVQLSCNPCDELVIQNPCGGRVDIFDNIGRNVPANVVPASLLQAPPFGVYFAGEDLVIDGAVQVCGSMPFSSAVEISGRIPASGSGCVKYECIDLCS